MILLKLDDAFIAQIAPDARLLEAAKRSTAVLAHRAVGIQISIARLKPAGQRLGPVAIRGPEDRKSTRLNSSHVVNSYAVFCLKKKKKQNALT